MRAISMVAAAATLFTTSLATSSSPPATPWSTLWLPSATTPKRVQRTRATSQRTFLLEPSTVRSCSSSTRSGRASLLFTMLTTRATRSTCRSSLPALLLRAALPSRRATWPSLRPRRTAARIRSARCSTFTIAAQRQLSIRRLFQCRARMARRSPSVRSRASPRFPTATCSPSRTPSTESRASFSSILPCRPLRSIARSASTMETASLRRCLRRRTSLRRTLLP
mmetsp:Transcript_32980/g.72465  ORF Transcript_32980/g.72465 Transcript_32980/m.72465 type:complete len:224 (-) Transcript_32980:927-1598(-)